MSVAFCLGEGIVRGIAGHGSGVLLSVTGRLALICRLAFPFEVVFAAYPATTAIGVVLRRICGGRDFRGNRMGKTNTAFGDGPARA